MSTDVIKTTPESYQLTSQESQFLETLKNTQWDIFETLDKKDVFHWLKEIPYTILREQLAEQQLLQLFPKSHKLRQTINQFDNEIAYFKMRYSDPIIVQRFADASGKTFDEAKEYLDNILATARIIPKIGSSKVRERPIDNFFKEVAGKPMTRTEKLKLKYLAWWFYIKRKNKEHFLQTQKFVHAEPRKSLGIHELWHVVNSQYINNDPGLMSNIEHHNIQFKKTKSDIRNLLTHWALGGFILFAMLNHNYISWLIAWWSRIWYYKFFNNQDIDTSERLNKSTETHSFMMQIRYLLNASPTTTITRNMVKNLYKELANINKEFIDTITEDSIPVFISLINTSF